MCERVDFSELAEFPQVKLHSGTKTGGMGSALLAEMHHTRWNPASNRAEPAHILQQLACVPGLANQVHIGKLE
jgi:hypothetical protein